MKKPLPRRTFLRGLGTLMALPALEAMVPRAAHAAGTAPQRFAAVWFSNGVVQKGDPNTLRNHWGCTGTESQWQLSRTLAPLLPYKADISVLHGLYNNIVAQSGGAAHWAATTSFLAGQSHNPAGLNLLKPGRSIDQAMADTVGSATRLRALTLGAQPASTAPAGDNRGTGVYLSHVSWSTQHQITFRRDQSADVFQTLFGGGTPTQQDQGAQRRREGRLSVLDLVASDATALKAQLGAADRLRLDEYLASVRTVEKGIEAEAVPSVNVCAAPAASLYQSETYRQRVLNLIDLTVLAFQCDLTRVATLMLDNEHNYLSLSESVGNGHSGKHHDISHYDMNNALAAATEINRWQAMQFAELLKRLKAKLDVDGKPLLDSAMVLYGSGLGDGDSHSPHAVPVVLAGKLNGKLRPGRFVNCAGAKYPNLLAGMLDVWGVPTPVWGDGDGKFTNL